MPLHGGDINSACVVSCNSFKTSCDLFRKKSERKSERGVEGERAVGITAPRTPTRLITRRRRTERTREGMPDTNCGLDLDPTLDNQLWVGYLFDTLLKII